MKRLAVMMMIIVVSPALAAGRPMSLAEDFSLASPRNDRDMGSGLTVGTRFSLIQGAGEPNWARDPTRGTVWGKKREFGPEASLSAGQLRPQPLLAPKATKSKGYALLGIGVALVAGGGVLLAVTDLFDDGWLATLLPGICCVAGGTVLIIKGLQVLILGTPGKYYTRERLGARARGGLAVGLRVSY